MTRINRNSIALAAAVFILPVHAHDAWVEPRETGYLVVYGHNGKLESYVPTKVKSIAAADTNGAALAVKRMTTADGVAFTVAGTPALLTLDYDNGFWSKTTTGMKNLPKNETQDVISTSHAAKFSKSVLVWSPAAIRPQGQQLEIVPLDAARPTAGRMLQVKVLWQGKPLPGAKVVHAGHSPEHATQTDANGMAALSMAAGRQILTVNHQQALMNDARADSYSASANLIFDAQ